MKALTTLAFAAMTSLLSPALAHAEVRVPGTFVPTECSAATADFSSGAAAPADPVSEICIGQITPAEGQQAPAAVSFQLADGAVKVFKIVQTADLMMAFSNGNTLAVLSLQADDGEQSAMRVMRSKQNAMLRATGHLNDESYIATAFQPIFVTE